jgi:acyl carrier protein
VIPAPGAEIDATELRSHLGRSLPEYMVPAAFMELAELPLSPNGKLDRKSLPAPEWRSGEYEAPEGETERAVAEIFAVVLKLERVGRHDNFFELGGHSLLATSAVSQLRQRLGVELPLRALFESPTVARLAERAEEQRGGTGVLLPVLMAHARPELLPLSYGQERLWILEQLGLPGGAYTIPSAVRLEGALEVEALERTLTSIVERHESLRTRFE